MLLASRSILLRHAQGWQTGLVSALPFQASRLPTWIQRRDLCDHNIGPGYVRRVLNAIMGRPADDTHLYQIGAERDHASVVSAMQGRLLQSPIQRPSRILDVGCDIGVVSCTFCLIIALPHCDRAVGRTTCPPCNPSLRGY